MARGDCTIARGNARRAQMMEVLRDHPEGMRSDAIAEAVGLSHSMGRYHTRMMGCLMRGWGPWVMYFHPDNLAEADAYAASLVKLDHSVSAEKERRILEFILSRARSSKADICDSIGIHPETLTPVLTALRKAGKIGKSIDRGVFIWHKPGEKLKVVATAKTRILELLSKNLSMPRKAIQIALEISEKRASATLGELSIAGLVTGVRYGVGKQNNKMAWCLVKNKDAAQKYVYEWQEKYLQDRKAQLGQLGGSRKKKQEWESDSAICNVEPIVLPGFTGRQFQSESPEPIFSSRPIGAYPEPASTAYARSL